jgi:hypothetical protein
MSQMTELNRRICVMIAYRDGKKIQMQRRGTDNAWSETYPAWDWASFDYRIAPEPRKPRDFWVYKDAMSGRLVAQIADTIPWSDAILVREVLPD